MEHSITTGIPSSVEIGETENRCAIVSRVIQQMVCPKPQSTTTRKDFLTLPTIFHRWPSACCSAKVILICIGPPVCTELYEPNNVCPHRGHIKSSKIALSCFSVLTVSGRSLQLFLLEELIFFSAVCTRNSGMCSRPARLSISYQTILLHPGTTEAA